MKKFLLIFLCIFFVILQFTPHQTFDTFADDGTTTTQIVSANDLETFISRGGNNRSTYTKNERACATYLAEEMQNNNLSFYSNQTTFIKEFKVNSQKSQNVIGVKKSKSEKCNQIVVGAHYDNVYTFNGNQTTSNGVFDNASGVVCVLGLMEALKDIELPFDVIYIFYGAEETGLNGSKNFVGSMSDIEKKKTILAFNFDSIGVGEYTYYYAGDGNYTYKKIFKRNEFNIKEMPKRINLFNRFENFAYTHIGLMSDNATYLKNKINCVTFFSGNLNDIATGYLETTNDNKHISHTKNDNYTYITQNFPNFVDKINDVALLAFNTITNTEFEQTLLDSKSNFDLFFLNNKLVISAIVVVCLIFICSIKKPKSKLTN